MPSRLLKCVSALAVVAVLGASPALAEAKDADLNEQMVTMLERQSADVAANMPDCDKVGDALLKHVDADAALMKKVMVAEKSKTKEQKQLEQNAFLKKYAPRMKAAQEKMSAVRACKDHAKLKQWKKALDAATDPRQVK
jgi:hypothetical protein